ncbi:MAG: radical SAM protein [Planctomycetes bacterium]|nr:radical SAM protein [Planctomycetota bacterium]
MALEGLNAAAIRARAEMARESLRACELCERRCGVDRLAGERAPCGLGAETYCFKRHVSFAEELELLPSYMVYFGGCNFRCRFCVQAPECFKTSAGVLVDAGRASADFSDKVARGAKTINLLGGEPTLHLHTILEIAAEAVERGERLPLVVNSNMYMTPLVIELLDGVASMYIADIKFGNDGCARELAGVERYVEVVTRNIADAAARTRVLVRHLLMPGHLECCLRPAAEWMARHLPEASFSLMTGYVPAYRAGEDATLNRLLTEEERETARGIVRGLGLKEAA